MSTEGSQKPIWTRPEPGARSPRFSRAKIASTAMAIADAEGLGALSMRRVAAELGAGTMTLYHYVRNKSELFELMSEAMMGELLVDDSELESGWREGLTAIAHASLRAWRAHPWVSEEFNGRLSFGPNSLRHFEQSLAAVASVGLPDDRRFEVVAQVDDYVAGFAQRERNLFGDPESGGRQAKVVEMLDPVSEYIDEQLETGEYPQVKAFLGDDDFATVFRRTVKDTLRDSRFERGLNRILDGFALEIERAGVDPA